MHRHGERAQRLQIPIHGVGLRCGTRHAHVVISGRQFAPVLQANEILSIRQPAHRTAAGERLKVDNQVKAMAAQFADAAPNLVIVPRISPPLSVKSNDSREIRIAFKQLRIARLNPPVNLRVAIVLLQQTQHWQRLHDVTERTGFEDENLQGRAILQERGQLCPREIAMESDALVSFTLLRLAFSTVALRCERHCKPTCRTRAVPRAAAAIRLPKSSSARRQCRSRVGATRSNLRSSRKSRKLPWDYYPAAGRRCRRSRNICDPAQP